MNILAKTICEIVREKVQAASRSMAGDKLEARFIFHGPPLELLDEVFEELSLNGGVEILAADGSKSTLTVLLQLTSNQMQGPNPSIDASGRCDESHLLHIRNDPNSASFIALMPPGQHNNRSVASTTEEFGLSASSNSGHATFEEWWADGFVQQLVKRGLYQTGIDKLSMDDALLVVERAAAAMDGVDKVEEQRLAVWRLLSRIYSIPAKAQGLKAGAALALACGTPPLQGGGLASKTQLGILELIAVEMADGFRTGIERISANADSSTKSYLLAFLSHVQDNCEIPTTFERATQAFYLPADSLEVIKPPDWWGALTTECWSELLAEEPDDPTGDLSITCTNAILPILKSMPAVVRNLVEFSITAGASAAGNPTNVFITGGSLGKTPATLSVEGVSHYSDAPPSKGQRIPITYKVTSDGLKQAQIKVISLASWAPGILVTCRMATKLFPPKKPKKGSGNADWETSMSIPGSGRYELLILVSPGVLVSKAEGVPDDATEGFGEAREEVLLRQPRDDEYQVEIEAEGKYQLEVTFKDALSGHTQLCRVHVVCEEAKEEGCKSEFERLIKLNRVNLEKFNTKSVIQLDRHGRSSNLQSWLLDEENISRSFVPMVLADDYDAVWSSPDWGGLHGPIMSKARFLHDPRPETSLFQAPKPFLDSRKEIAERIRETNDNAGLVESAPLGKWLARDASFRALVETYLDSYTAWLAADRDVACWIDAIAVCPREGDGRTLSRIPDAIILSPLHPLRLAWHCLAQKVLFDEVEGDKGQPCPAASILDPDCIPDLLTMSLQAPGGATGIDHVDFLSVECDSDYWSVLWNGKRLSQIASKARQAPFDTAFGLGIGGISSGFSPAQVARALEDVFDLLAAKPVVSLVVSSAGGATDACNDGLSTWCSKRFGSNERNSLRQGVGPRILEIFDTRPAGYRPDQAVIANLAEDTGNHVRWFERQPANTTPDLGIIAQLDSAEPSSTNVDIRSPLGTGGLIRHRVRRQLNGAFLSESRQGLPMAPSGDVFADKVAACLVNMENGRPDKVGLEFAPNVFAVANMLEEKKASFVAVSSSAIDPACFLGGWIKGTYLWDYDLPSYSHRAGDTSGYYLLSQVRDADREALSRLLEGLPGCEGLDKEAVEQILLEVARRGIPTVRGLSGEDTGATGDFGLFLAVRLLQDQFRISGNVDSLVPVLSGTPDDATLAIIVPVDPFRGYLADLARSLGKDRKDLSLSRPDLLVIGVHSTGSQVRIHLTPIEVKSRHKAITLSAIDAKEALAQARSFSTLLNVIQEKAKESLAWKLAYQHLLLSMVGFGLRVYSQQTVVATQAARWATYHERIAAAILGAESSITADERGRLIVIDGSRESDVYDHDADGFFESIFISPRDAGQVVAGDAKSFYSKVRAKVGDWQLLPISFQAEVAKGEEAEPPPADGIPQKLIDVPPIELMGSPPSLDRPITLKAPDSPLVIDDDAFSKGIVLSVGRTVDGFEPRDLSLNISDTKLNQLNIGVVGDLGTGKTQLLKSLIFQITTAHKENRGVKPRLLIFDYKRDYSSPEFVAATGAKVIKPHRLPLNLFDTTSLGESAAPWLDRFRFFVDVLDKVYSGIGPVQRDKLKGAVRKAYEACSVQGRQPTIYDIHAEYRELLSGKSDSPMAIIDDLVDMEIFEKDPSKTKPFNDFFDGIVVISLDALGQDDRSKNMLVAIMLNMFYENMLRTPKRPFIGSTPQLRVIDSYLLVDEADNIMRYEFDVLRKLLLQGREFGAGVILASQYLRHFKTSATDYREPLLTWFIHKVPNVTAAELGSLGFTSDLGELSERVKTLLNHQCLFKSFDVAGEVIRGLPFFELPH
jgi:DNA phosphorothioation-dependent restriction protein DptH